MSSEPDNSGRMSLAVASTLTLPNSGGAYAVGDAVANSGSAASVTPLEFLAAGVDGHPGYITGAQCYTDQATSGIGALRLWLFNQAPFASGGYQADNAALALTYAAIAAGAVGELPNLIGFIDFPTWIGLSTAAVASGEMDQAAIPFQPAAGTRKIFGLFEARAVFTAGNGKLIVPSLHISRD
jgi:hypothetical protein